MRILHTSDWHLGKYLDGNSRLDEQKEFVEELCRICDQEEIELILLAGDVYDNGNPSAQAEELFYKAAKKLTKDGKRPMIAIAGNHDSPERLMAADVLSYEHGIVLLGMPGSQAREGSYEHYEIARSGSGFLEMSLNGHQLVILTMAYPSEKRLAELVSQSLEEEEMQQGYSQKIGERFHLLEQEFREDTINLAMGHFYTMGGEESGSERPVQLGGALSVNKEDLPLKAQYTALGHLHKSQAVPGTEKRCQYSGSPIAYSKQEAEQKKYVHLIDVFPGQEATVTRKELAAYKPVEIWHAKNMEEALELCQEHSGENSWVYLEIETDRIITQQEIRQMRETKEDIVEIIPFVRNTVEKEELPEERTLDIRQQFIQFCQKMQNDAKPSAQMVDLFLELLQEERA